MYSSTLWRTYSCRKCSYANQGSSNPVSVCTCNGSRFMGRLPTYNEDVVLNKMINKAEDVNRNCCYSGNRSNVFSIKSGQQPNSNEKSYSYSYKNYLKNKRKDTYETKLPTKKPTNNSITTVGYKGNCEKVNNCNPSQTIWRVSNKKFHTQGAVSSSSRLDRLKYDTILGSSNCPPPNNSKCNGVYFAGKPRYLGPKGLFNENHKETNCPQYNARSRAMGSFSLYPKCK